MSQHKSSVEDRALDLLGKGIPQSAVALTLGVDPSRISQLLSDKAFADQVIEKKFVNLSSDISRDKSIDSIEDKILERLDFSLPMISKPMDLVRAFTALNMAKRRSRSLDSESGSSLGNQTIIQLNIPSVVLQSFRTNINNQVIAVGDRSLLTMPSNLLRSALENPPSKIHGEQNEPDSNGQRALQAPTEREVVGYQQEDSREDVVNFAKSAFTAELKQFVENAAPR